jgi:beta-glucosidase
MSNLTDFPANFLWGAATSAYQVEGSPLADGAGPNIWHRFSHTPGRILNGDTGDVACDHYRRYPEDIAIMQRLGLNAYRFSLAWSRVLPEGRGRINSKGLDFYQRLVDTLLERGIVPFITLYHWDLPLALEAQGGWLNRDSAFWFAEYAQILFRVLSDRVRFWITLNEPWVIADKGYLHGIHAPGHTDRFAMPVVSHNLLRAHALAVQAYRTLGRDKIGIAVNVEPQYPASEQPEDRAARDRAQAYINRYYLDPIFFGSYPEILPELFGPGWPEFSAADLKSISQPIDFLGINYYSRAVVRHDPRVYPTRASSVRQEQSDYTALDWEIYPQGLLDMLLWIKDRYGKVPLYITENGAAFSDPPVASGPIEDPHRTAYLRDHLRAAHTAIQQGVDLYGYFVWSLLDNFEWQHGYSKRFWIVHVDFASQKRTPKASAYFYAQIAHTRGAALFEEES